MTLSLIWPYFKPYRGRIVVAFIALLLATAGVLVLGLGIRELVDRGLLFDNPACHLWWGALAVGFLALASFGRTYYVAWLGEQVVGDIRQEVFKRLLQSPALFFESVKPAELISRLTTDIGLLQAVIGNSAALFMRNVLLVSAGLTMMVYTSVKLSLYTILIVPMVITPVLVFGKKIRYLSKKAQGFLGETASFLEESIYNIRTVQLFTHEAHDQDQFQKLCQKTRCSSMVSARARAWLSSCVMLIVFGAVVTLIAIGRYEILQGRMNPGDLSAFLFFAVVVAAAMGSFGHLWGDLQRAAGAAERLVEMLHSLESPPLSVPLKNLEKVKGIIAVHNLSFCYPSHPNRPVLNQVTFSVSPGETLAIVGPSGAGKTTIFSLLLGFYPPQKGTIYLDGIDCNKLSMETVRRHISLVSQDPAIFSTSIYQNILYADPKASNQDIKGVLEAVDLLSFVSHLPQGWHTLVGVRGIRLSGGQKQRLALARTLLRSAPILLLDEATNSLDARSEEIVQQNLEMMMKNRTTIVIAHRLSTALRAQRIIVLDQGRIQAVGSHADLIAESTLYRHLAALQFV